jgi:hypothetical protein
MPPTFNAAEGRKLENQGRRLAVARQRPGNTNAKDSRQGSTDPQSRAQRPGAAALFRYYSPRRAWYDGFILIISYLHKGAAMRIFLLTMLGIAALRPASLLADISVTVSTDQFAYVIGEPIAITVSAVNARAEPVVLRFPTGGQSLFVVDNMVFPFSVGQYATQVTVPGNGTFDWDYYHDWGMQPLSIGSHEVIGRVLLHPNLTSPPVTFNVAPPDPVLDDIFIDFQVFPDGTPVRLPNGSLTSRFSSVSYAAWGVRFDSDDRLPVTFNFSELGANNVLADLYGDSPWNIVAQFDMPVFTVSADVGANNGETVTMSAFDAAGNLLGIAVSAPTTDFPHLAGPLRFTSPLPIASVEWKASDPLSTVRIDNLRLDVVAVPEPPSIVLAVLAVVALLRNGQICTRPCRLHPVRANGPALDSPG